MFCKYIYLCTTHVPVLCGVQKRALDTLELEVKAGASMYVLETDPGPLQEQQMLYIAELFL